ncbi:hypothetical protein [Rhodopila globiformis]|uniref:Uncharacterized protein n=1 Tax=Rhodopila globiformis TaxID=1071 RepID=A0A2S6NL89_RHOGL|nr:hypothetical protein [Rhodopila globiformis]PPQ36027.1 hypothetical protein CCS01_05890 [Rhodopila globiformis]
MPQALTEFLMPVPARLETPGRRLGEVATLGQSRSPLDLSAAWDEHAVDAARRAVPVFRRAA